MRAFEFQPGEVISSGVEVMTIDLDSIQLLKETPSREYGTFYTIVFAGGSYNLTPAAYHRLMLAWKSK